MFVLMSVLVLIASMNIISGLVMLVKNKGRDIGILRTMGLTEGSVLRVFFLVGASTGLVGTVFGVVLGVLFAIYIDPIFGLVDELGGARAAVTGAAGVANLGVRPTVGTSHSTVEVHLLDFDGDLYGTDLRTEFVEHLREERRFDSLDDLVAQIGRDAGHAREYFDTNENGETNG